MSRGEGGGPAATGRGADHRGGGQTIGTLVETHEFAEKGGVTTMRITQKYGSKDARDGAIASGMDQGMEAGYQQLDAMLARPAQGTLEH